MTLEKLHAKVVKNAKKLGWVPQPPLVTFIKDLLFSGVYGLIFQLQVNNHDYATYSNMLFKFKIT